MDAITDTAHASGVTLGPVLFHEDPFIREYLEAKPEQPERPPVLTDQEYRPHFSRLPALAVGLCAVAMAVMVVLTAGDGSVIKPIAASLALVIVLVAACTDMSGLTAANSAITARHQAATEAWHHERKVQAFIRAASGADGDAQAYRTYSRLFDFTSGKHTRLRRWLDDHPLSDDTQVTLNRLANGWKTRLGR